MSLKVWLPLNGNLENKGLWKNPQIFSGVYTYDNNGKIGSCICPTDMIETDITKDVWDYVNKSLTMCCWVKFNYDEIKSIIESKPYTSTVQVCGGTLVGRHNYGGLALRWNSNNIYSSKVFNTITIYGNMRSSAQSIGTTEYTLPTNTWTHVCLVVDRENGKLISYINGNKYNTISFTPSKYTEETLSGKLGYLRLHERSTDEGNKFSPVMPYYLNDVRIYDEALSDKQIKEIAKGLVAHYKFDDPYIENVTNLVTGLTSSSNYTSTNNIGWDTSLNPNPAITPSGWSNGYNGGVPDPTHGYHAHWIKEDLHWIMEFPNLNSVIDQKGRWLGISGSGKSDMANILAGEKYVISWWQKTTNLNLRPWGGIYYKKTSSDSSANFYDGYLDKYNTKVNTWQFMWKVLTRNSEYVQHSGGQSLYVYGQNATTEGTIWVKDVQVVRGDKVKPYTVDSFQSPTIKDSSSYGHDLTQVGTQSTLDTDGPRYSANIMNNNNDYFYYNGFNINGDSTFSAWFKIKAWKSSGDASSYIYHLGYGTSTTQHCIWVVSNSIKLFANGTQINPSYSFSLNTWYHVVTTISGTTANIYINGVNIKTATCNAPVTCNLLTVMNRSANSTPGSDGWYKANGNISDLRFYATALSADDIKQLYNTSAFIDNKNNMMAYEFVEE